MMSCVLNDQNMQNIKQMILQSHISKPAYLMSTRTTLMVIWQIDNLSDEADFGFDLVTGQPLY